MAKALTILLTVLLSGIMQAQNIPSISMDIAALQSDSPVQIVSTKSTSTYMFDSVEVINRSDRTISSITFALSFQERHSTKQNQFSIRLRPRPARLESKSKTTLDAIGHPGKELMEICASAKMGAVMATIGVVEVEFTEGDRWRYEIENEHRHKFPSHDSLKARARFINDPEVNLLLAGSCKDQGELALRTAAYNAQSEQPRLLPVFQGGGYFSCESAGNTSCILCTNQGSSCTVSICQNAQGGSGGGQSGICFNCPKQTCSYHPPPLP